MAKKELFHKLTNYKEQLEVILDSKNFSIDAKNLLLNMLYKIENSYNDYETVKRRIHDKKTLIENILNIIERCNSIELIEPNSQIMKKLKKQKRVYEVNKEEKKINVIPDEKAILEALYELEEEHKIYIDEEYFALRNALPFILNEGQRSSKVEIIRDFNAWSWNTDLNEIENIECNLIYNNLLLLLGNDFLAEWQSINTKKNTLQILNKELNEYFNDHNNIKEFLDLLYKISIIIYCKKDKKEKQILEEELEINKEELERLSDTEKLIDDLTKSIKKNKKDIEKIEKILSNEEQMQKELEKTIEKDGKFITEKDLKINLNRKKRKLEKQIKEANKLLDGKYYSEYKKKIEDNVDLLKAVKEQSKKKKYIINFQKCFIKAIKNRIELISNKKDIMDMVYIIRYYNFMPYSDDAFIKDVPEIKSELNEIEELLLNKMEEFKVINKFSNIEKFDRKLIKKVFKLRIINLETIYLEFQKGEKIRIIFYDDDTIEKGFEVKANDIKISKYNKRIKMFS